VVTHFDARWNIGCTICVLAVLANQNENEQVIPMRNRLPTLLILTAATWLVSLVGAVCGELLANERSFSSYIPSIENVWFSVAWGLVFGIIPSGFVAALLADDGIVSSPKKWLPVLWVIVATASGMSLYLFSVTSASI